MMRANKPLLRQLLRKTLLLQLLPLQLLVLPMEMLRKAHVLLRLLRHRARSITMRRRRCCCCC
jgi:hypothetical protein